MYRHFYFIYLTLLFLQKVTIKWTVLMITFFTCSLEVLEGCSLWLHVEKTLALCCAFNGWDSSPGDQERRPVLLASATLRHYKIAACRPHCSARSQLSGSSAGLSGITSQPQRVSPRSVTMGVFLFICQLLRAPIRTVSSEELFSQVNVFF